MVGGRGSRPTQVCRTYFVNSPLLKPIIFYKHLCENQTYILGERKNQLCLQIKVFIYVNKQWASQFKINNTSYTLNTIWTPGLLFHNVTATTVFRMYTYKSHMGKKIKLFYYTTRVLRERKNNPIKRRKGVHQVIFFCKLTEMHHKKGHRSKSFPPKSPKLQQSMFSDKKNKGL